MDIENIANTNDIIINRKRNTFPFNPVFQIMNFNFFSILLNDNVYGFISDLHHINK